MPAVSNHLYPVDAIQIEWADPGNGYWVLVAGAQPVDTNDKQPPDGDFRFMGAAFVGDEALTISSEWEDTFGGVYPGQAVWVRLTPMSYEGLLGAPTYFTCTVNA